MVIIKSKGAFHMSLLNETYCDSERSLFSMETPLEGIQEVYREYGIESHQETNKSQETGNNEQQLPFGEYSYYWFK